MKLVIRSKCKRPIRKMKHSSSGPSEPGGGGGGLGGLEPCLLKITEFNLTPVKKKPNGAMVQFKVQWIQGFTIENNYWIGPLHPVNFDKVNVYTFKIPIFLTYRNHKFGLKKRNPSNLLSFPNFFGGVTPPCPLLFTCLIARLVNGQLTGTAER